MASSMVYRQLSSRPMPRPCMRQAPAIRRPHARRVLRVEAVGDYEALRGVEVISAATEQPVELLSLWQPTYGSKVVLPFLTHFADLSSWEYGQKLVRLIPTLEASGVKVITIGIGTTQNAQLFCRTLRFPTDKLFVDPTGTAYKALQFSPGFGPELGIPPAAKLIPMLMGIGSPGTLQEVARGYVGDSGAKQVFESPTPFDVLGTGYQRPFELATLRLFNMIGILPKWSELAPPDDALLTQQGGTLAFDGEELIYRHDDAGILKYTDVDEMLRTLLSGEIVDVALAQYRGE